eukprot:NODE_7_length_67686_cov_1.621421.p37 type:complete len:215 gc:universal NODE_7_length_67686_cov_1.621421:50222-50866(+)
MHRSAIYSLLREAVQAENLAFVNLKQRLPIYTESRNILIDIQSVKNQEKYYLGYLDGIADMQEIYIDQLRKLNPDFEKSKSNASAPMNYIPTYEQTAEILRNYDKQKNRTFLIGTSMIALAILFSIYDREFLFNYFKDNSSAEKSLKIFTGASALGIGFIGIRFRYLRFSCDRKCRAVLREANVKAENHLKFLVSNSKAQMMRMVVFKEIEVKN